MSGGADDGFLARWARRKGQAARGITPPAEEPQSPAPAAAPAAAPATASPEASRCGAQGAADAKSAAPAAPAPTLDDVAGLTPTSDFTRFVARDVDASVKNAALKKLFADPHFNVMDGLDTYIDDYNRVEPMPRALLRQTMQARVLGLLDDELEAQPGQPAQQAASSSAAAMAAPAAAGSEACVSHEQPSAQAQAPKGLAATPPPPEEHRG